MTFNRSKPSPRYLELLGQYKSMHTKGDIIHNISAEDTFDGRSLAPHVGAIKMAIENTQSNSLLDYGCGKAKAYDQITIPLPDGRNIKGLKQFWEIDRITLFDPGHEPYSAVPTGKFDAVICTDVLEHCPEEDINWILSEIFEFSTLFVFCTVALYPAAKSLPSGENAHITLKSVGWWVDQFETASRQFETASRQFANRKYFLVAMRTSENMMFIES